MNYENIEFKKSCDVSSVTSSLLRQQINVTRFFFYFEPLTIKISGYASDIELLKAHILLFSPVEREGW